jgi:NADH-quinone oxidoreductase subunit L
VSQLGYMMLALGSAGYVAGVFHLMTHAFFKALLFLAAGSVIHAVHTQNIEEMGGLWKKLKLTGPLFLIGTLAISGVPLLSGFFSKDEILAAAWEGGHPILFLLALIAAFFTAFYMFRLFFLVFTGEARGDQKHVHESPSTMTLPMIVLGVLAIIGGYVNTPWFGSFLGDWLVQGNTKLGSGHAEGPVWIQLAATIFSLGGIFLAWLIYGKRSVSRDWLSGKGGTLHTILLNKYYIDEFYQMTIVAIVKGISYIFRFIDVFIVEGLVKLVTGIVQGLGKLGSKLQSGQVQTYSAVAFIGLAVLVVIFALTGGYLR